MITNNPTGTGNPDPGLPAACGTRERQSAWYVFGFNSSMPPNSLIEFTITPTPLVDYDFALWGPNIDCADLSNANLVRCNFSGAPAPTGLSNTQTGNTWEPGLVVQPGEVYILLIDNFSISSTAFQLDWGGSAAPFLDCDIECALEGSANQEPLTFCQQDTTFDLVALVEGANGPTTTLWTTVPPFASSWIVDPTDLNSQVNVPENAPLGEVEFKLSVADTVCAIRDSFVLTILPSDQPVFSLLDTICASEPDYVLPTSSDNGISGNWAPATINTSESVGEAVETVFTPDPSLFPCAESITDTVYVAPLLVPEFDEVGPFCALDDPLTMPTTSTNGVSGSWSVPIIDPSTTGGARINNIFTPDASPDGCIEEVELQIEIEEELIPDFDLEEPCEIDPNAYSLPTTSSNGITGTWDPANITPTAIGSGTVAVVFIPDDGFCVDTLVTEVTILEVDSPVFVLPDTLCELDDPYVFPDRSDDGIEGSWTPSSIDPSSQAGQLVTSTFRPDMATQPCAAVIMRSIYILPSTEPVFDQIGPLCELDDPITMPTTSTTGIVGTWSIPVIDPASFDGQTIVNVFTAEGEGCIEEFTMTIEVEESNPPVFTLPELCENDDDTYALPTESVDGISGTWSPATIEPRAVGSGVVTVEFTPDNGQCADVVIDEIVVVPLDVPTFDLPDTVCSLDDLLTFPNTSNEGILGVWNPSFVDPSSSAGEDVLLTFTPDPSIEFCAATITRELYVRAATTPTFDPVGPLCDQDMPFLMPTASTNGIVGTWSIPVIDTASFGGQTIVNVFTAEGEGCIEEFTMTIEVEESNPPVFTLPELCENDDDTYALPTESVDGISGTWSPATIEPRAVGSGVVTVEFTPDNGQCADVVIDEIVVVPLDVPTFDLPDTVCSLDDLLTFPNTSNEGILGVWNPSFVDPSSSAGEDVLLTFTPDPSIEFCAATITRELYVRAATTPTFDPVGPLCDQDMPFLMPTTSLNGVMGTWSSPTIDPSGLGGQSISNAFLPDLTEGCAELISLNIEIEATTVPIFELPTLCADDNNTFTLPAASVDGITGTWNPSEVTPAAIGAGTIAVEFTPDSAFCAETMVYDFFIVERTDPVFSIDTNYCLGAPAFLLPAVSNDGVAGSWSTNLIDPSIDGPGSIVTVFTAAEGCYNPVTVTIVIEDSELPIFDLPDVLCSTADTIFLVPVSDNDIAGAWDAPFIAPLSAPNPVLVTFTPAVIEGCVAPRTFEIEIETSFSPSFLLIDTVCVTDDQISLPDSSSEGVPGSWSVAVIDPSSFGGETLTTVFTPDSGQCATERIQTFTALELPQADLDVIDPSDCGVTDGRIQVNDQQGLNLYEYRLNDGPWTASTSFDNLGPGTYALAIRPAGYEGCVSDTMITLENASTPSITNMLAQDITNCGLQDGRIDVVTDPGLGTLEYSFDGGLTWQLDSFITNLDSGTYVIAVRVQSQPNCVSTGTAMISTPMVPTLDSTLVTDDTDCMGDNGEIEIIATGMSLEYSADNGSTWQASPSFVGLAAGSYTVVVREADLDACQDTAEVSLTGQNVPQFASIITTSVSDCGLADGTITISSDEMNIEYSFDGGLTWGPVNTTTDLLPGAYEIAIRFIDGPMCSRDTTVNISAEGAPEVEDILADAWSDCGSMDGRLTIRADRTDVEYSIDGGMTWLPDSIFMGLDSGNYAIQVRLIASPGCVGFGSADITAPMLPILDEITVSPLATCEGMDAALIVEASLAIELSLDRLTWTSSNVIDGLGAGDDVLFIRNADAPACIDSLPFTIDSFPCLCDPIEVEISTVDITCFGAADGSGQIVSVAPIEDYTISWSTGASNADATFDQPGDYYVIIDYDEDCADTTRFSIAEPEELVFEAVAEDPACPEGLGFAEVTLITGGTPPYTVLLGGVEESVGVPAPLEVGMYPIVVTDILGCEAMQDIVIREAEGLDLTLPFERLNLPPGAPLLVEPDLNGTDIDSAFWTAPDGSYSGLNLSIDAPQAGMYMLTVVIGECVYEAQMQAMIEPPTIYVPNAFSPNGDQINDVLRPYTNANLNPRILEFQIYDRYGAVVFERSNQPLNGLDGWDGDILGERANEGGYAYRLVYRFTENDRPISLQGDVILVR